MCLVQRNTLSATMVVSMANFTVLTKPQFFLLKTLTSKHGNLAKNARNFNQKLWLACKFHIEQEFMNKNAQ